MAVAADGSLYISDQLNNRIRQVSPKGVITTFAGTGAADFSGDGGPAAAASLSRPDGVAVGKDGSVYISDQLNSRIRRVSRTGVITTVAGKGEAGFSGDNGPATAAEVSYPNGVAVGDDGSLYIADFGNSRIRKVSPSGVITTVVGGDQSGFSGDNGPATVAKLSYPNDVTLASDGSLYIADQLNDRIRRVSPAGIITTVAGNGERGFGGDGGPATAAALNRPNGVVAGSDGSLYIADEFNDRIRRVSPSGTITTVAGNGERGFGGDGGPGTGAALSRPNGVAVGGDGSLYVADQVNNRIRRVSPTGLITTVAGNRRGRLQRR